MSRSIPLAKAMKDGMIVLYQNGEHLRPSNGYPMRLVLPGYEGNMNIKWLRRIKITEGPTITRRSQRHQCPDPTQGADAQPRQFHQDLSKGTVAA
jgi:DMSO/TMAO reductase YedYZ molybdopterin-dependent catalytic subunit